jgi:tRNA(fMet)-specific endonuclease VapC
MNLLFDTNIILFIIRDKSSNQALLKLVNPDEKSLFISIVSVAELYSIAFQNRWNSMQLEKLEAFLNSIQIVMVDDFLTET